MSEHSSRPGPGDSGPVDFAHLFAGLPTAYLVVDPDLVIVEANEAYLHLLGRRREDLLGRWTFEAFPPAPDALDEQGRNPLQLAFEEARDTGRTVPLPLFEYAVRDLDSGEVLTRYWSLIICPLQTPEGRVSALLQRVEDVTDYVHEQRQARADVQLGRERVQAVEGDLYRRVQQLQLAQSERERAVEQLARLSRLAMSLAEADNLEDVERIVLDAGSQVLGVGSTTLVSLADGVDETGKAGEPGGVRRAGRPAQLAHRHRRRRPHPMGAPRQLAAGVRGRSCRSAPGPSRRARAGRCSRWCLRAPRPPPADRSGR